MTDKVYIDGIDIYSEYGVIVTSSEELLTVPPLQEPDYNDWPEENGIDPDLTTPVLTNKTVSIEFAIKGNSIAGIDAFLAFLTTPGYHIYQSDYYERSWNLRPLKELNRTVYNDGQSFAIQFADDFPLVLISNYQYVWGTDDNRVIMTENAANAILYTIFVTRILGHGLSAPMQEYHIDGLSFNEYGLCVLEGSRSEVYKMPELKENLTVQSAYTHGVKYDTDFVRFKAKDVTLKCTFYCDSVERFWNNYCAFFSALVAPNARKLFIEYMQDKFECYYKNSSNFNFIKEPGRVVCSFDLTLCFTNFRPKTVKNLLMVE